MAESFEYDGATYIVTSENKVELQRLKVEGDIMIRSSVEHNGAVYSVTSIGAGACENCFPVTAIYIPSSVVSIGERAFEIYDEPDFVHIPSSVVSIGEKAFHFCQPKRVYLECGNEHFALKNGVLMSKDLTTLVLCTIGLEGEYEIPNTVTAIPDHFFTERLSLTKVVIPASVKLIGDSAFYYCVNLTSLLISNGVETIGASAFGFCGLYSVTIPSSVKFIKKYAFADCVNLRTVDIQTTSVLIADDVFAGSPVA